MDAPTLTGVLGTVREAVADVELPDDPFHADALSRAALTLSDDLLDLAGRINGARRANKAAWHAAEAATLDVGTKPPPSPPPPPTPPPGGGSR